MSCGACSLCCKVLDVPDLQKAGGKWCAHAVPGKGCGVYDIRPQVCRDWACIWLQSQTDAAVPMALKLRPDHSHVVLVPNPDGSVTAQVDADYPGAANRGLMRYTLETLAANGVDVSIAERNRIIPLKVAT